jgi:drug/metabolite transporter (DMT)-like permease
MPFEFLKLPFTAALAYLLFSEMPSMWTWLGGAIIFAATVYIGHREAKVARLGAARTGAEPLSASPAPRGD